MNALHESARSAPRSRRRELAELALRAALPAAMALATILTLTLSNDRTGAAETLFLALWAAAVFLPLTLLETASAPVCAALNLATTVLICTLPRTGGLRSVAVAGLLALAVLILGSRALTRRPAPDLRTVAALALAAALVLHGHRIFRDGFSLATLVLLAVLPGLAAAAAAGLSAAGRPGAALAAGFALIAGPQLSAEPWWVVLVCATAASAASLAKDAPARLARRALGLLGAATLLAGSFPWLRPAPIATLLGALATLDRPVAETPLDERAAVLTRAAPRLELELSGAPVRGLILDTYLTNGVDLPCGQALASVELLEEMETRHGGNLAQGPWSATLIAGRDSAEWAAGRPDVAARLACAAPPPWISWIPAAGRFLGQTTRARFALPLPRAAYRLAITRSPELPTTTSLAIFFVATER